MTKWTDKEIGVGDLLRNLGIICEHVEGVGGAFADIWAMQGPPPIYVRRVENICGWYGSVRTIEDSWCAWERCGQ